MAVGAIVYAARQGGQVTAAVRVNEGAGVGLVEYVATVPAVDARGDPLPPSQVKAALVAAWAALRSGGASPPVDVGGQINGNVNV